MSRLPLLLAVLACLAGEPAGAQGDTTAVASLSGKIEVTQGIQDRQNRVRLIAGKDTWARALLSFDRARPFNVRGYFQVLGADSTTREYLSDSAVALAVPGQNARMYWEDFTSSLNLYLPPQVTLPGRAVVRLVRVLDTATGREIPCSNCALHADTVEFEPPAVLRLKVIGFRYRLGGRYRAPTGTDFDLLESWLRRAYPATRVEMERGVMDAPGKMAWQPDSWDCDTVNRQLARIRALDVKGGQDPRVHYYGMVADRNSKKVREHMRGCASGITDEPDPGVVASGPSGAPDRSQKVYPWDLDDSYADWYGAHEIAHTFGRRHPKGCIKQKQPDDPDYPYPPGWIGKGSDGYLGLDPDGARPRVLRGYRWTDLMSYCENAWISAYTYQGILDRLREEEDLYARGALGGRPPPAPTPANATGTALPADTLVNLLVKVTDLDKNRGNVEAILTVQDRGRPAATDSAIVQDTLRTPPERQVEIELLRADGSVAHAARSWIRVDQVEKFEKSGNASGRRILSGETGTVSAYLPNRVDVVAVRVRRNGETLDSVGVSTHPPELAPGFTVDRRGTPTGSEAQHPDSIRFQWKAYDPDGREEDITYFVQFSGDGSRWSTIWYTGENRFDLPYVALKGRSMAWIRVLGSDGKNDRVLFQSCNLVRPEPDCR